MRQKAGEEPGNKAKWCYEERIMRKYNFGVPSYCVSFVNNWETKIQWNLSIGHIDACKLSCKERFLTGRSVTRLKYQRGT